MMRLIPACERVGLQRLPRNACVDGHRWRLACGTSLPVAIDVAKDAMLAGEARDELHDECREG